MDRVLVHAVDPQVLPPGAVYPLDGKPFTYLRQSTHLPLQTGLAGAFSCRIKFGFIFVAVSWVAVLLTIFLSCRPFQNYFIPSLEQSGESFQQDRVDFRR